MNCNFIDKYDDTYSTIHFSLVPQRAHGMCSVFLCWIFQHSARITLGQFGPPFGKLSLSHLFEDAQYIIVQP